MTDELDLDLGIEEPINKTEQRIKNLSDKVRTTAEERDAEVKAREAEAERANKAEKERDFYANLSDSTSKYPAATEYKDAIKEKVMSGYSVEDATVAVLAKEGKLNMPTIEKPVEREIVAGGSAINTPAMGEKPINQMSQEEKRQGILDAQARGDISLT